jgi:hypothetical protein
MKKSGSTATTTIDNSNNLWTCSCGIARDTVEILDRLSTRLDLCEYTGPVGLEALAGHADYPYSDAKPSSRPDDSIATGATTAPRQPQHGTQQPPFQYSNDLAALMEDYHSSIHAIRLPPFKTQSRATSRLRKTLDPFFDSVAKEESWTDTRARLFQQQQQQPLQERAGTTTRNSNAQAVSNITRRPTLPSTPTPRMAAANGESHDQQPNPQTEQPEQDDPQKLPIPSYEVRLLGDIDLATSRKEHIQKAVRFLLQRGETPLVADTPANDDDDDDLMQAPSRKQPPHRADDVSSIGIGGISVASTNQYGRAALDTLLSKARVPRRVATQRSQQDKPMRKSPTTTFLSMDQGIEESGGVAEGDEDWASDVSNLSLSDDNDEDGASAATSAVGRRALETLLHKVAKGKKPASRKATRKRARPKSKEDTKTSATRRFDNADDASTVASSSTKGQGKAALDTLLNKAGAAARKRRSATTNDDEGIAKRRKQTNPAPKKKMVKTSPTETTETKTFLDKDDATAASASTVGHGRAALNSLLSTVRKRNTVQEDDDEGIAKRRKQTNPAPKKKMVKTSLTETMETKTFLDNDDATAASASTVGHGRAALNSLLSTVRKRNTAQEDDDEGIAKRRKQTNPAPKKKMVKTSLTETSETKKFLDNDDATAASASTVGHGRAALNSLLSTVRKRNTAQEDEVSTNRKKAKGRAKVQERAGTTIDSIDTSRKGAFTRGTRLSVDNQNSTRRKAATVSKKPKRRHDTPESDTSGGELESSSSFFGGNESVAASINTIGAGGNALNALLSTATESHKEDADRQDTPGQHDGKSSSANESESQSRNGAASMNDGDSISAMSSTGPGRSALDALLARVGDKP